MRIEKIILDASSLGTQKSVTVLHFGSEIAARKIYIQASLHADELPGALTAYHLRSQLLALEQAGLIDAHIVLVPLANPIGLSQKLYHTAIGRFEFSSGRNFNRFDLDLYQLTKAKLNQTNTMLGGDESANVRLIREAMSVVLTDVQPKTELESLHLCLLRLAYDADVVLDLHCDERAVLHMYTLPQLWTSFEPLACYLGSQCQLLSEGSGVNPFDELLSTAWLNLQRDYPQAKVPIACATTTVELRSRADITHEFACQDADAIIQYLHQLGDVRLSLSEQKQQPMLLRQPSPLEGKEYMLSSCSGVVVYHVDAGESVARGQLLAEMIDPVEGVSEPVVSSIAGFVYARGILHFAQKGEILYAVAGNVDLGRGASLSP